MPNKLIKQSHKSPLKLIAESDFSPISIRSSDNKKSGPMILSGVFMESGRQNCNGRIYRREELESECERFNKEMIDRKIALCELEHPEYETINPDRACARITKLEQDDDNPDLFIGEAVVLSSNPDKGVIGTPCGNTLASLIQYGTKFGFSSRGYGEVSSINEDINEVSDFHLITVDVVLQPSIDRYADASGFVNGILESKQFIKNENGDIVELKRKNFKKAVDKIAEQKIFDRQKKNEAYYNEVISFFESLKNTIDKI